MIFCMRRRALRVWLIRVVLMTTMISSARSPVKAQRSAAREPMVSGSAEYCLAAPGCSTYYAFKICRNRL